MNNTYHFTGFKKSLFGGYYLTRKDANGRIVSEKLPKSSAFKIKAVEGGFVFTKNGTAITPTLSEVWINGNTYTCATADDTRVKIDIELGNVTPEYKFENGNLLVDVHGTIYTMNTRLDTTRSDSVAELDDNNSAVFIDDNVLCKNPDGTYQLIDSKLNIVLPENAENTNISLEYSDSNGNKVFKFNNKQFLCYANGGYKEFGTQYKFYSIKVNTPGYVGISGYDPEKNTSTNIILDTITNEFVREHILDNVVKEVLFTKDNQALYITKSLDNKMGVVDEFGNEVVPHTFDNISLESLKNNGDVVLKVTSSNQVGVFSTDGTQLTEVKYDEINVSESDKVGEVYKFLANQDGLWGVTNSKGVTEVKFEYKIDTADGREIHAYQETPDGREVEYIQLVDAENKPMLLNLSEQNPLTPANSARPAESTVEVSDTTTVVTVEEDVMSNIE